MTTILIDTEATSGPGAVIPDPDGSGFHIQLPDTTIEVSSAQLSGIVSEGQALLGISSTTVKPAFFGDSNFLIRSGVVLAQTFPAIMATAMGAATHGVFAVGGETSGQGLARIQAVIDFLPTHVFLDFGVNDADLAKSVTPAQYEANMRSIIGNFLGRGIKVVLMSPIFIAETGYLERQRDDYMPRWYKLTSIPGVIAVDCWARMAALTMSNSRPYFDGMTVDSQHWSATGNVWRKNIVSTALGL